MWRCCDGGGGGGCSRAGLTFRRSVKKKERIEGFVVDSEKQSCAV
jgi:hypothetical protein